MQMLQKLVSITFYVSLVVILVLPLVDSYQEHVKPTVHSFTTKNTSTHKLSPSLLFEITLHGFLLWASMGFLMPAGILAIRMSHRVECRQKLKILFYVHSISQMISVLLATAAAVMSITNFDNSFHNHHQRIGVALYGMVWLQALLGFLRPHRGCRGRSVWFLAHWMHGTAVSLLGVINTYVGLQAYHQKTSRSIQFWIIIFTIEVSLIVFFYLLQDKWAYMQKQGVTLGNEPISQADRVVYPQAKQTEPTTISC